MKKPLESVLRSISGFLSLLSKQSRFGNRVHTVIVYTESSSILSFSGSYKRYFPLAIFQYLSSVRE